MPGYRTIPTKDTFDVDERLGGIVTVKQLAYLIVGFIITYAVFVVSNELLGGSSDSIFIWGTVLFLCLMFTFGNVDRWAIQRFHYYFGQGRSRLEQNPQMLRNVRSEEEDKIVTLDGRVIAVLKITPINFPLLSDEAKEAKIAAYETYLRQLVYPIMHIVQSDEVNMQDYFANVERNCHSAQKKGIKGIGEYASGHIKFLREYLKKNQSRAKNHYVVLQVQDPRFKASAAGIESSPVAKMMLSLGVFFSEFNPVNLIYGGSIFAKPPNYVRLDITGKRMIYDNPKLMPKEIPARASRIGQILQFESPAAMLRYAKSKRGELYYADADIDTMLKEQFRDMPLKQREAEFSVDERRRHVGISGGKTRWAFDEAEKHITVLSDKLEAAGLRVRRVRGEELYIGRHMNLTHVGKIKVMPDFMKVDNTYMKVVYATGYPYQVNLGWLSNIVDGRDDYDLMMYIYPVSINEAITTFRSAILKLTTEKKARSDFLDPETEQHLDDVTKFYTQIVAGKEKYFQASLYITPKANSLKTLDTVLEKCKSDLAGASIDSEVADYNMARAVFSTRLTGYDMLGKKREFPSSSLAATFPHISSSLEIDEEGMFFGFDWMDTPVIVDLKKLPNQHISILGESGSGKSYFAKSIIPLYLMGGYRVFITDPDGEYVGLAKTFGGTISTVGPKYDTYINPFDLEGREVNDKIRSLLGMFSIMCGQLNKYQEGIISDVLIELFEKSQKRQVTMSDFSHGLQRMFRRTKDEQMRHDIQYLEISIRPFTKGNLYGFIDRPTSIKMGKALQVFDLREYQNDKTLRDLFNYLIFDYISHALLSDRTPKALIMDEGWTMVDYPGSEDYVRYIIKDSRKYNVSFVFITQELEDMLSSAAGKSVLNNTSTQFLFHQKESAMPLMKKTLNLTDVEYERLIAASKGEGLMVCDKNRLFFRVRTSKKEHMLISTDPNLKKKDGKLKVVAMRREEVLSPALRAAMGKSSEIAKEIGITKEKNGKEEQEQNAKVGKKRGASPDDEEQSVEEGEPKLYLPIALTHGLVSEKEKMDMLKPLSLSKLPKKAKKK